MRGADHVRVATSSGPRRRDLIEVVARVGRPWIGRRWAWGPVLLAVALAAATVGAFVFVSRSVDERNQRLLVEQAEQTTRLFLTFAEQVDSALDAAVTVAAATQGDPAAIREVVSARTQNLGWLRSIVVLRVDRGGGLSEIARAGRSPAVLLNSLDSEARGALQDAAATGSLRFVTLTPLDGLRVASFAGAGDQPSSYVAYGELALPPVAESDVRSADVDFAVYAKDESSPESLVMSTTTALPLSGTRVEREIVLEGERFVAVYSARNHLVGAWTAATPWIVLGVGLLVALLGAAFVTALQRRRAETLAALADLERAEARYRSLFENATETVAILDPNGTLLFANRSIERMLGHPLRQLIGRSAFALAHPDDQQAVRAGLTDLATTGESGPPVEARLAHADGSWRIVELVGTNLLNDPTVGGVVVNFRDVTELRRSEAQFRQAQKLEALGRLAGGIAHDFNNLLTIVLANSGFLLDDQALPAEQRKRLEEVEEAAQRGAALTKQLLAFSRKQTLQMQSVDVNVLVTNLENMLRRLIGDDVELAVVPGIGLVRIHADPGQVEQALLNLAVNARDAMPKGGKLTIETRSLGPAADTDNGAPPEAAEGSVEIRVVDTGCGMDSETMAHVFEPFFTTKDPGEGTGLGLATVHGIVQQNGGSVRVESKPGQGTTFLLVFPSEPGPAAPAQHELPKSRDERLDVSETPETPSPGSDSLLTSSRSPSAPRPFSTRSRRPSDPAARQT